MQKPIRKLCAAVCVCTFVIAPALAKKQKKTDPAELRKAIETASADLIKATIADDWETVFAYYTDDALSMPNYDGMLEGKPAIMDYYQGMRANGVQFESMDFAPRDLWACDDHVYETGTFEISLRVPGMVDSVTDQGKYVTVWRKDAAGDLKIKAEIWNTDQNPWVAHEGSPSEEARLEYERLLEAKQALQSMADDLRKRGMIGLDGDWDDSVGGYRVKTFVEGTNAEAAGVLLGDVLTKINGILLSDREGAEADAANRVPGREVSITVLREGAEQTMHLTLVPVPEKVMAEEIGRLMLNNYLE
jgi:ketosteroid isomerase-like protein